MKTRTLLLIIFSLIMPAVLSQQKPGREDNIVKEPGKEQQTEMLIDSRNFVFQARRATPSNGASIDLTTNRNYVKFEPDLIESYMPFFGRAYSGVGYNDTGLHFKGQPDEFTVEKRKGNFQVTASVKAETDNFRLFLTVTPKGYATLSISSNNRESISYTGEISDRLP